MLISYLKTAVRNLLKHPGFSIINILGLTVGMAACLLILSYVSYEKSYDSFHENSDNIYRMRYQRTPKEGANVQFASCCPPASQLVKERYPEVLEAVRIYPLFNGSVSYKEKRFLEKRVYYAEQEFFKIFSFKFISGNPDKALEKIDTVVLTQSAARKYFGDEDPMGKTISVNNKRDYLVTGVMEDIPSNSHLKFDMLLSFPSLVQQLPDNIIKSWGYTLFYTYLLLDPKVDPWEFEAKLPALVDKEVGEYLKEIGMIMELKLQPLKEIHLTSHYMQEYEVNGDKTSVHFLFIIAFLILLIAWVNYINLSTARSLTRAREVGIRKTAGATRGQLMQQFFIETLMLNVISILLAIVFIELALPFINNFTGTPTDYSFWSHPWLWFFIPAMLLVGVFLSGFYPMILMSSFKPQAVLKGKLGTSIKGMGLRKGLVLFQFTIAILLFAGTITIYKQLNYMKSRDLGFNLHQVMVIQGPKGMLKFDESKFTVFKEEALKIPGISKSAFCTEVPGRQIFWDNGGIRKAGTHPGTSKNYQIVGIDNNFIDFFQIQMVAGRKFSSDLASEKGNIILSETASAWMGFKSPEEAINQKVDWWGNIHTVVGVIKDIHQQSLKEAFEPHLYTPKEGYRFGQFVLKVDMGNIKSVIKEVGLLWKRVFPRCPHQFFFLDQYYDEQYNADRLFGRVFTLFSVLALILTALGILGLSHFTMEQRTKEIGIRKVIGASVPQIFFLLTRNFLVMIGVALAVSIPIYYYIARLWLESFAYKMPLNIALILAPGVMVMLVTLLTVGYQTIKAAVANPVNALRYE